VSGSELEPDGTEFQVGDEPQCELVLDSQGSPVNGEELVCVVSVEPAKHTRYGPRDVRVMARLLVLRTGQVIPKFWTMVCDGCGRQPGAVCRKPSLKLGCSGYLRRDTTVALGRGLTPRERVKFRETFVGKSFRAAVRPVHEDADGNPLEAFNSYSVGGRFLSLQIGDGQGTSPLSLAESISPAFVTPNATSNTKVNLQNVNQNREFGSLNRGDALRRRDDDPTSETDQGNGPEVRKRDRDLLQRR
jgi:hypothetical protein